MKKKAIEKIPYMKIPKVKPKKTVKYVGLTKIMNIDGENHLLIEVYRNRREDKQIPVVRIAITEKDFGNFFPETGAWSREKITNCDNCDLIWRRDEDRIATPHRERDSWKTVLYSEADTEKLHKFLKNITRRRKDQEWWTYVYDKEESINTKIYTERKSRKYKRRAAALKERMENTEKLPEKRVLRFAEEYVFRQGHILYYKKNGARAAVACTGCGMVTTGRWKPSMTYESQFETRIEEPQQGYYGICPHCKETGRYVAQGHAGKERDTTGFIYLGQQYKENGFLLRYVKVWKTWILDEYAGEKGPEMIGAKEMLSGTEIARVYFEPGKKIQTDFCKYNYYRGEDFWDDCNLYGMHHISMGEARIMPETYTEIGKTFLKYSALKEYSRAAGGEINAADYLTRYIHTPQLEMLVKLNLIKVVNELVEGRYGIVNERDAKSPDRFLGIRKERVKQLIEKKGDIKYLRVMQLEARKDTHWTDEEIDRLVEIEADNRVLTVLEYMSLRQFLNRVSRYAGCEFGGCGHAMMILKATMTSYIDYLEMRKELGYDMTNTVYLFPRDLDGAHTKMVAERNSKAQDERMRDALKRFPMIKRNYRKLRKKFYYEDDTFIIRPARDAGEIIAEGRTLHHCVGGDSYLRSHNEDRSYILFMRFKNAQSMPYITVEIEPVSYKIRQWYGAHDKKPDADRMQKWLDAYVTRLICGTEAAGVEEQEQRLLIAM